MKVKGYPGNKKDPSIGVMLIFDKRTQWWLELNDAIRLWKSLTKEIERAKGNKIGV